MHGDLIILDLETTGLDPQKDAIIEFGAVKLRDGEIVDTYSTLINPDRPIPPEITALTGIRDEDFLSRPHKPGEPVIRPAPYLNQALPIIRSFVGNAPIIGHNIGFDLSFLYPLGIFQSNLWIDTYDLASILLPSAIRYNLASLANEFNIELVEHHRALDDARATGLLYWVLWEKALSLSAEVLQSIINVSYALEWNARSFFQAAYAEKRSRNKEESGAPKQIDLSSSELIPLDSKAADTSIEDIMGERGLFAVNLAEYEDRPQQSVMAKRIWESLQDGKHLILEAGTGIGKSLAYLLPSALWAVRSQQRVVVSTYTLNLQDQILSNDIPLLEKGLKRSVNANIMKGRGNYLCIQRLSALQQRQPADGDELRILAKVLVWLSTGGNGEKNQINLRGPVENGIWSRLSAEDENCSLERCEVVAQGQCPFYKARKAAEAADILVVNHALLLTDSHRENQVLPAFDNLIIDEAHHFESAVTDAFTVRIDESYLRYRVADLTSSNRGLLAEVLSRLKHNLSNLDFERLRAFIGNINASATAMEMHLTKLFQALRDIVGQTESDFVITVRLEDVIRKKSTFVIVQEHWQIMEEFFLVVSQAMEKLAHAVRKFESKDIPNLEVMISSIQANAQYFASIHQEISDFVQSPKENTIYWIAIGHNRLVSLNAAPLHVGKLVQDHIWNQKRSVILTSATLQPKGNFNHIQERLGTDDIPTDAIDSPFDYRKSTLIYVPNDMPEPNEKFRYQSAVERSLVHVATALDGKTLALFTSYSQLQQTAQAIRPLLALGGITVFDQLDNSNRQVLIDSFKAGERSVLLGTRSFWEGIDIPGVSLSALVITRLPFPVPNEPIFSARSETYKDAFNEYTLPEAIIRFKQGFGRLIRSSEDRGIVVLLDKRIISKGYGQAFLDSLPDCTVQFGALDKIGSAAQNWLAHPRD